MYEISPRGGGALKSPSVYLQEDFNLSALHEELLFTPASNKDRTAACAPIATSKAQWDRTCIVICAFDW